MARSAPRPDPELDLVRCEQAPLRDRRFRFYPEQWLVPVIVLALAAWYEWSLRRITASGFPLDGAWIHLQFARNPSRDTMTTLSSSTMT